MGAMDGLGAGMAGFTQGLQESLGLIGRQQHLKAQQEQMKQQNKLIQAQQTLLEEKINQAKTQAQLGVKYREAVLGTPDTQMAGTEASGVEGYTIPGQSPDPHAALRSSLALFPDMALKNHFDVTNPSAGRQQNPFMTARPGEEIFDTRNPGAGPIYKGPPVPEKPASAAALNNPYGNARAMLNLKPSEPASPEQAKLIFDIVAQHARAKGVSPDVQVYNDTLAATGGDHEAAQHAVAEFRGLKAGTEGRARTIGQYTGPAQAARVDTAEKTASAGVVGRTAAELSPVTSPVTGEPTPRATAVKQAEAEGQPIPASERKALSELAVLNKLTDSVVTQSKDFTAPFFGPVTGRLGLVRERVTGNMGEAEVGVRRNLSDIKDTLLRARSGAQINEQEYSRLSRLVPDITDPSNVAKFKMKSFREALRIITEERKRLQGTTGGVVKSSVDSPATSAADPLEGRTATGKNGAKIIRQGGKWVPYVE